MVSVRARLIVPVAASPELLDVPSPFPSKARLDHATHAHLIAAHCCLLFRDLDELAAFQAAVKAHPLGTEWETAMDTARVLVLARPERCAITDVTGRADLKPWAFWSGVAQVSPGIWRELVESDELLATSELAVRFGKLSLEAMKGGATSLQYSSRVRAARRLGQESLVHAGTDREQVASEYLTPMLRYAQQVTIVDPYLGSELIAHQPTPNGALEWLLKLANKAAPRVEVGGESRGALVDILTTWEHSQHEDRIVAIVDEIVERIMNEPARYQGVSQVRLFLHERCAESEDGHRFRVGTGQRFVQVTHGGNANRFYAIRSRLQPVTTHLKLEKGLSPLGVAKWREGWQIHYQPGNSAASLEHFNAVEREYDLHRDDPYVEPRPRRQWPRQGVPPAGHVPVSRVAR